MFHRIFAVLTPLLACSAAGKPFNDAGDRKSRWTFGVYPGKSSMLSGHVSKKSSIVSPFHGAPFSLTPRSASFTRIDNFKAVADEVKRLKPATVKGRYITKVTITSTMNPGVPVDPVALA